MYVKVTVYPDFKKEKIEKKFEDGKWFYVMYIREEASRGQANKKVIKVLEGDFSGKRIRILTGAKSTQKLIQVF